MKIICVDNFGKESKSDSLVCENVNLYMGNIIVEFLIEKFSGNRGGDFFKLVEDDYKLYIFKS